MSTCTRKVLTVLAEKGQKAEFKLVDIMKGEARQPDYLALQPFAKVPALDDEGFILYESRAIARYLDEKFPQPSLHGEGLKGRALVEQWISIESANFTPSAMKIIMAALFAPMGGKPVDAKVVESGREALAPVIEIMERQLSKTTFIAANHFTIADIGFMPYIEYLQACQCGDLFTGAKVGAWWQKISQRDSWKSAIGG